MCFSLSIQKARTGKRMKRRDDSLTPEDQSERRLSTRERVAQMVEERHRQREEQQREEWQREE